MGKIKDLASSLNAIMEFDHVIRVHEDLTISEPEGFYAPILTDSELDSTEWTLFTKGYSGQYSYSGPVMHDSEYIGGRLAEDILSQPGLYVAVVANWFCDCDGEDHHEQECEDTQEGWAVVFREWVDPHNTYPHSPGMLYDCLRCESECFCDDMRKGLVEDATADVECVHCGLQG